MRSASFHPEALAELSEAEEFYEARQAGLGSRFASAVEETVARIVAHPQAGRSLARGIRRQIVSVFPYAVVYRVSGDLVFVLAVAHQHRRPGYWRRRIRRR